MDTKTVVTVNFASIWKKREVYSGRAGLHGTNIFLSEDLGASQHSLFFKCRERRCSKKIQSTWTQDLKIFVRDNNDQKIEINTEAYHDVYPTTSPISPPPSLGSTTLISPRRTHTKTLTDSIDVVQRIEQFSWLLPWRPSGLPHQLPWKLTRTVLHTEYTHILWLCFSCHRLN